MLIFRKSVLAHTTPATRSALIKFMPQLLFAILFAVIAQAQPYRVGNGVKPPSIVSKSEPQYSEEARKSGAIADVLLSLVVDEQGHVSDIKVMMPVGMGLDEQAIETVRTWQFKPGVKDDAPVPVIANIEINFRLLSLGTTFAPRRVVFDNPSHEGRPVLKSAPRITLSQGAQQAGDDPQCVTVRGSLESSGKLSNLRVEPALSTRAEREFAKALEKWTLEPGAGDVRLEFCAPDKPLPRDAIRR